MIKNLELCVLVANFIVSFFLSVGTGANDVANTFGSIYGSRLLPWKKIIIFASIFEFLGAMLIGKSVSDTLRNGIINSTEIDIFRNNSAQRFVTYLNESNRNYSEAAKRIKIMNAATIFDIYQMGGFFSIITASTIWMLIANIKRIPVSTTHSIVGSILGYGIVLLEGTGIIWITVAEITASWIISPLASGCVSVLIFVYLKKFLINQRIKTQKLLIYILGIYFITIFLISLSVIYRGPDILMFYELSLRSVLVISLLLSLFFTILVFLYMKNLLKKNPINSSNSRICLQAHHSEIEISKLIFLLSIDRIEYEIPYKIRDNANSLKNSIKNVQTYPPLLGTEQDCCESINLSHRYESYHNRLILKTFRFLQILLACYGSYAHGGNDVSNSITPVISSWLLYSKNSEDLTQKSHLFIIAYGASGIVLGLALWGERVLMTVGIEITKICQTTGLSIELGSVLCVIIFTKFGIPISTTHCKIGSVVAIGLITCGVKSINPKLLLNIILSWFVTVPISGILSASIFICIRNILNLLVDI